MIGKKRRKKIKVPKRERRSWPIIQSLLSFLRRVNWVRVLQLSGIVLLLGLIFAFTYSTVKSMERRQMEKWKETVFPTLRVEIYNASGYTGLAKKLTWYLRDNGVDVVYYGNASDKLDRTVIVDRVDSSMKYARIMQKFLGGGVVKYEPDADRLTTITILIGKDFYDILPEIRNYRKVF